MDPVYLVFLMNVLQLINYNVADLLKSIYQQQINLFYMYFII